MVAEPEGSGRAVGSRAGVLERKLTAFLPLSPEELSALRVVCGCDVCHPAGISIIRAGQIYENVFLLKAGWACKSRILRDGDRQIVDFLLPGDFVCLGGAVFTRALHDITTLTRARLSPIRLQTFMRLNAEFPRLAAAIGRTKARDDAILEERLVSIGRRSPYQRIAHLLIEMWRRLTLIGLAENGAFDFPLSQNDIGDALGLSAVHVNRMIRRLREDNLIRVSRGPKRVSIVDMERLKRVASFDEDYLNLTDQVA